MSYGGSRNTTSNGASAASPTRNGRDRDALEARHVLGSRRLEVREDRPLRGEIVVDEHRARRAARERLDRERSAAGVEVEHAGIVGAMPAQRREQRLLQPVGARPRVALRRDQPPPTDGSRDHAQRHGQTLRGSRRGVRDSRGDSLMRTCTRSCAGRCRLGICAQRQRRALNGGTRMLAVESTDLQWATFVAAAIGAVAAFVVVIIYAIQTYIMIQTRVGTSVIEAVKWMQSDEMRQRRVGRLQAGDHGADSRTVERRRPPSRARFPRDRRGLAQHPRVHGQPPDDPQEGRARPLGTHLRTMLAAGKTLGGVPKSWWRRPPAFVARLSGARRGSEERGAEARPASS